MKPFLQQTPHPHSPPQPGPEIDALLLTALFGLSYPPCDIHGINPDSRFEAKITAVYYTAGPSYKTYYIQCVSLVGIIKKS